MLAWWTAWLRSRFNEEGGQNLVEWALIVVLIAIALIAVVTLLTSGRSLREIFGGSTPTP